MLVKLYNQDNLVEVTEISSFRVIENGIELIQTEKDSPIGPTIYRKLILDELNTYFDEETQEWFSNIEIEADGKVVFQSVPSPPKSSSLAIQEKAQTIALAVGAVATGLANAVKEGWHKAEAEEEQKKVTRWLTCCGIIFVLVMVAMIGSLISDNDSDNNSNQIKTDESGNKYYDIHIFPFTGSFNTETDVLRYRTDNFLRGWFNATLLFDPSIRNNSNNQLIGGELKLRIGAEGRARCLNSSPTNAIYMFDYYPSSSFTVVIEEQTALHNDYNLTIEYLDNPWEPNDNFQQANHCNLTALYYGFKINNSDEDWIKFDLINHIGGVEGVAFDLYDENETLLLQYQSELPVPYYNVTVRLYALDSKEHYYLFGYTQEFLGIQFSQ